MLTYEYTARDTKTGEHVKAMVEADSESAAARLITQEGFSPIKITLKDGVGFNPLSKFTNRVRAKDRILFARQLSTLINAGLPLVQSLRSVSGQTESKPLKVIINKLIADIEGGSRFAVTLGRHPKVFNQVFVSLVAAGETSGTLDRALERIADQQEKDAEILSKVRGAMAYPVIVLLVMIGVVGFMVVKVLPAVEELYKDMPGASLPFITKALLSLSHFIIGYWWVVIIAIVFMIFVTTRWARTFGGKQFIDKAKMRMWPIGPLFMKLYMARFARTGTTLVSSGVPLLQVLEITSNAINNVHVQRSLMQALEKVKGGKDLSSALRGDPNFLDLVPNMISIGEQSGSLETMLEKIADYYEKEVDTQIRAISTIIEPVMMVLLGVVAFTIVAAILLPIYGLAGQTENIGR